MKNLKLQLKIRNFVLVLALLVFAVGILGASIWRTSAQSVSKNYQVEIVSEEEATESVPGQATEAAEEKFNYFKTYPSPPTYPGILPGHFLYPLKMIRDRILLFFTTDPLKKAELFLQFADKRARAAQTLIVEKDKINLGITTLTKAEKYLERSIDQERIAKEAGRDTTEFLEKLSHATQAHEEVILGFEEKIPNIVRPVYDSVLQYARMGYQRVRERMEE